MKIITAVVGIVHDGDWFLLLKKTGAWTGWQFPQGGREAHETMEEAVLREIKEETGLTGKIEKKLKLSREYWFMWEGEKVHKLLTYFLVKANKSDKVSLCEEHCSFEWIHKTGVVEKVTYNKDVFAYVIRRYFP